MHTSSVFLIVFGLCKSVNFVQSFTFEAEKFIKNVKNEFSNDLKIFDHKHSSMRAPGKKENFNYPIVINTWPFVNATAKAWDVLMKTDNRLDASR